MKTFILALIISFYFTAEASILTVDNNSGSGSQYTTLSSAISAANNGDTLLVHASPKDYGSPLLTKKLVIVGSGFHPDPSGLNTHLSGLELRNGSSGSIITGIYFTGTLKVTQNHHVHNISIFNNYFSTDAAIQSGYGWSGGDSDNWIIEGNAIISPTACGGCKLIDIHPSNNYNDNWVIRNNFIQSRSGSSNTTIDGLNATTLVMNNIFVIRTSSGSSFDGSQATFQNNIFYITNSGITDINGSCVSCVYLNNLTYSSAGTLDTLPGTNNIDNQDPQFQSASTPTFSINKDFSLKTASSGHNAGTDGTDVGVYGGGYNFDNRVLPKDFPRIDNITVTNPAVPQGQDLIIKVKAKKEGL